MIDRTREFSCSTCRVDFEVRIEPGKSDDEIESQFPDSIKWLDKLDKAGGMECPVCGALLPE